MSEPQKLENFAGAKAKGNPGLPLFESGSNVIDQMAKGLKIKIEAFSFFTTNESQKLEINGLRHTQKISFDRISEFFLEFHDVMFSECLHRIGPQNQKTLAIHLLQTVNK